MFMFSMSLPFNVTRLTRRLRRRVGEGGEFHDVFKTRAGAHLLYFRYHHVQKQNGMNKVDYAIELNEFIKGKTYILVSVCTTIQEG